MHGDGPALVIAGPGSGKTTVLTNRIKYLIKERDIPPEKILTITFSKAASIQMRDRFNDLCEDTYYPVTFGTFHSVFFKIVNQKYHYNTGDIVTLRNKREYMKRALFNAEISDEPETELIDSLLKSVAYYKNRSEAVHISSDTNLDEKQFIKVYRAYRDIQISAHKIDFEDMLLIVRNLFVKQKDVLAEYRDRYRYILIDEYQDINDVQYDIVRMLAAPRNNLFVVGDDDQSIYGFRGSRSELMLGFVDAYPDSERIMLTDNYRSATGIIDIAGKVISENEKRFDKKITAANSRPGRVALTGCGDRQAEDALIIDEIRKSGMKDTAVFLRTNREASRYAELIRNAGMECDMKEAVYNPYKSAAFKDFCHYMRLVECVKKAVATEGAYGTYSRRSEPGAQPRRAETGSRPGQSMPGSQPGFLVASGRMAQMVRTEREMLIKRVKLPVAHLFPVMNKPLRYLNRRNIMCDEVSIEGLKDIYCDKPYMDKVLDKFAHELAMMCDIDMYGQIDLIRRGIGYDEYVMNSVAETKDAYDEYTETADWIQDRVRMFKDPDELERYAEEYEEMSGRAVADHSAGDRATGDRAAGDRASGGASASNASGGASASHASGGASVSGTASDKCIHIMTYHASKGLEFDTVILPHLNEGSVPNKKSTGKEQIEEERRMLYVAMTRAKNTLIMTYVSGDKEHRIMPSRFILPLIGKGGS